jgi:hypothetical protein
MNESLKPFFFPKNNNLRVSWTSRGESGVNVYPVKNVNIGVWNSLFQGSKVKINAKTRSTSLGPVFI